MRKEVEQVIELVSDVIILKANIFDAKTGKMSIICVLILFGHRAF